MYLPLCGGGWCGVFLKPPRGLRIPPRPSQDRRDWGVSAIVWGLVVWCLFKTPTGRPYPLAARTGTGGTRVYLPMCGGGECGVSWKPPRDVPIPPQPTHDRRDSGASARCVGVGCVVSS